MHEHAHNDPAAKTKALESLLVEKGLITSAAIDEVVKSYEEDIGPMKGAQVVARAWGDSEYKQRLLADGRSGLRRRTRRNRLHLLRTLARSPRATGPGAGAHYRRRARRQNGRSGA